MSKFYIFTNFVEAKDYSTARFYDKSQLIKYANQPFGSKKNTWDQSITLLITNQVKPADYLFCGPLIVVSKKLFDILNGYAKDDLIEFLPVQLIFKNEAIQSYGVLNFLEEKEALDKDKSVISYEDGFPEILRIVLDQDSIGNDFLFYIKDSNHAIVVDERVKNKIETEHIRGISFKTPEEWRSF